MKNIVTTFIYMLLISLFSSSCDQFVSKKPEVEEKPKELRYVKDQRGTIIRNIPVTGKAIGVIPYNDPVEFISEMSAVSKELGVEGKWTKIIWEGTQGWVFGGFLDTIVQPEMPVQEEIIEEEITAGISADETSERADEEIQEEVMEVDPKIASDPKVVIMKEFLQGIISLRGKIKSASEPIKSINAIASEEAAKTIDLTKANLKGSLEEARNYSHCIITVSKHTIVKITDFDDCSQSGSWGVCMPKGEGYVQKRGMNYKEDHINNIIGRADSQIRTMFLFQ